MNKYASAPVVRGLLYKEWLKLRYLGWIPFVLLLVGLTLSFWDMQGAKSASGGFSLWHRVMFRSHMPFKDMLYLPTLAGIWLAALQFVPECLNRRLRLFFHLPVNEYRALCLMMGVGAGLLLLLCGLLCLGQTGISLLFMPQEIAWLSVLTLLPWCLAGFIAYAATALILLETSTRRRLWYVLIASVFVLALLNAREYGSHINGLPWFGLVTIFWFATVGGVLERVKRGRP